LRYKALHFKSDGAFPDSLPVSFHVKIPEMGFDPFQRAFIFDEVI
jgi:hypothetical protein